MKHSPAVGASSTWLERDTHYQLPAAIRDALQFKLGLQGPDLEAATSAVCGHLADQFGAGTRVYVTRAPAPRPTREQIRALWNGNNMREVCETLGVHRTTVYRAIDRYPSGSRNRVGPECATTEPAGRDADRIVRATFTRPSGTAADDPDLD